MDTTSEVRPFAISFPDHFCENILFETKLNPVYFHNAAYLTDVHYLKRKLCEGRHCMCIIGVVMLLSSMSAI